MTDYVLSEGALRKVIDDHKRLEGVVRNFQQEMRRLKASQTTAQRDIRVAKTATNDRHATYPAAPANVFVVQYQDWKYARTPGDQQTTRKDWAFRKEVAHSRCDNDYWSEGSEVVIERWSGLWWIEKKSGILVKTPPGGIPKITDETPGVAACAVYELVGGDLVEVTGHSVNVYNLSHEDIAGDRYLSPKRDCGCNWFIECPCGAAEAFCGACENEPPAMLKFDLTPQPDANCALQNPLIGKDLIQAAPCSWAVEFGQLANGVGISVNIIDGVLSAMASGTTTFQQCDGQVDYTTAALDDCAAFDVTLDYVSGTGSMNVTGKFKDTTLRIYTP